MNFLDLSEIMKYFMEEPQIVYRIGGSTRVFGKLVNVTICLGIEPITAPQDIRVMFKYLN